MPPPNSSAESPRAEARRSQILEAARSCVRNHGFHGASITLISAEAGMSAGHIYHYFESKEAIISAIVEQDIDRVLTIAAELSAGDDVPQVVAACTANCVSYYLDPDTARLKLEIAAEASRNQCVSKIVRSADQRCRKHMFASLCELRRTLGHEDDADDLQGLVELFATMFDGLLVRAVRNPDVDHEMVVRMFRKVILMLMRDKECQSNAPRCCRPPRDIPQPCSCEGAHDPDSTFTSQSRKIATGTGPHLGCDSQSSPQIHHTSKSVAVDDGERHDDGTSSLSLGLRLLL